MLLLVISGVFLANIPGIQILHLFLLYGQIRAATLLPTIMAIIGMKISERGVFWGITTSFLVGLPIFAWGNFNKDWHFIVTGSLLTVLASGVITIIVTYLQMLKHKVILESDDVSTNELAN